MSLPTFAIMDKTRIVRINIQDVTHNTYRFIVSGLRGMYTARKNKDKRFKFYRKKPFVV